MSDKVEYWEKRYRELMGIYLLNANELAALRQYLAAQEQAWNKIERRTRERRLPSILREQAS